MHPSTLQLYERAGYECRCEFGCSCNNDAVLKWSTDAPAPSVIRWTHGSSVHLHGQQITHTSCERHSHEHNQQQRQTENQKDNSNHTTLVTS